jgi:hypothetical protein
VAAHFPVEEANGAAAMAPAEGGGSFISGAERRRRSSGQWAKLGCVHKWAKMPAGLNRRS